MLNEGFKTFRKTNKHGFNKFGVFQFISSTIIVYICQDFKKSRFNKKKRV